MTGAMTVGFVVAGVVTHRLEQHGITARQVAGGGMTLFIVVQVLIMLFPDGPTFWLWAGYGLFGTSGMITYTGLTRYFGATMAGRANTAANLTMFVCAFLFQAGTGALLEYFPTDVPGRYTADGHQLAFGIAIGLQILALIWYLGFRVDPPLSGRSRTDRHA